MATKKTPKKDHLTSLQRKKLTKELDAYGKLTKDIDKAIKKTPKVLEAKKSKFVAEKLIKMDPKVMERYRKLAKAPLAKKVVKRTAKKGIGKKIVSKLGVPGKVIAGAWAAYDIVKGLSDADKESVSTSDKCQKRGGKWVKGKCVLKKPAKTMPSSRGLPR